MIAKKAFFILLLSIFLVFLTACKTHYLSLEEAEEKYKKVLEENSTSEESYRWLAVTYSIQGKQDELIELSKKAQSHYENLVKENPNDSYAYSVLGHIARTNGETKHALELYGRALEIDPNSVEAHRGLGELYLNEGKVDEAVAELNKALESDADNYRANIILGNIYLYDKNMTDYGIKHLDKALEAWPNREYSHSIFVSLGNAYTKLEDFKKAEKMFKEALEIYPNNYNVYNGLGNLYKSLGNAEKSKSMFEKSIELNPDYEWSYIGLANLYISQGELEKAETLLLKAIEVNPKNTKSYSLLEGIQNKKKESNGTKNISKV